MYFVTSFSAITDLMAEESHGIFDYLDSTSQFPSLSQRASFARWIQESFESRWEWEPGVPVTIKRILRDAAKPLLLLGFDDPCWVVVSVTFFCVASPLTKTSLSRAIIGLLNTNLFKEVLDENKTLVYFR